MKSKAIVLGCGMIGATMARDLASDDAFDVTVADVNPANLDKLSSVPRLKTLRADLSSANAIRSAVRGFDIVLGALPSALGYAALEAIIDAGINYCDISFMEQDALQLRPAAENKGVTAVVDCGVAPGLSHMIVGHVHARLDHTDSIEIYVGGLPKVRTLPYEYKAPFAPADVIEEYTRPTRLRENGKLVTRPALTEPELLDFPQAGTLEAFNTDGLRSLLETIDAPNMKEKTLRYPGHIDLMRTLRDTGFFSLDEIEVKGARVRPRDLTAALLFPLWSYKPGEEDFTVLRVVVEGIDGARRVRHTWDLYDEYDSDTNTSSMARTTAFPAVIVARMIAAGQISEPGVFAPEQLAQRDGFLDHVLAELKHRGVELSARSSQRQLA